MLVKFTQHNLKFYAYPTTLAGRPYFRRGDHHYSPAFVERHWTRLYSVSLPEGHPDHEAVQTFAASINDPELLNALGSSIEDICAEWPMREIKP